MHGSAGVFLGLLRKSMGNPKLDPSPRPNPWTDTWLCRDTPMQNFTTWNCGD